MEIEEILKLVVQNGIGVVVAIMVLKFMFRIVEKKFDVDSNLIQKNYDKNVEIANCVTGVSKSIDNISANQVKLNESQIRIVNLIDSVDKRINGYKKK